MFILIKLIFEFFFEQRFKVEDCLRNIGNPGKTVTIIENFISVSMDNNSLNPTISGSVLNKNDKKDVAFWNIKILL